MDGRRLLLLLALLAGLASAETVTLNVQTWNATTPAAGTPVTITFTPPPTHWQPSARTPNDLELQVSVADVCVFAAVKYAPINKDWESTYKWFSLAPHLIDSAIMSTQVKMDMSQAPFSTARPLWKLQLGFVVTSKGPAGCSGPTPPVTTVTWTTPPFLYWDPQHVITKGGGNMFFPSSKSYSSYAWTSDINNLLNKYGGSLKRVYIIGSTDEVSLANEQTINATFTRSQPIRITGPNTPVLTSDLPGLSASVLDTFLYPTGISGCNSFIVVPSWLGASNMLKASAFARFGRAGVTPTLGDKRRCFLIVADPPTTTQKDYLSNASEKVYSIGLSCSALGLSSPKCVGGYSISEQNDAYKAMYDNYPDYNQNAIFCGTNCLASTTRLAIVSALTDAKLVFTSSDDIGTKSFAKYAWDTNLLPTTSPRKFTLIDSSDFDSEDASDIQNYLEGAFTGELTGDTYLPFFDEAFRLSGDRSLSYVNSADIPSIYHMFYRRYNPSSCEDRYLVVTDIGNAGLMAIAGGVTGISTWESGEARQGPVTYAPTCASGTGGPPPPPTGPCTADGTWPIYFSGSCGASPSSAAPGTSIAISADLKEFSTGNDVQGASVTATVTQPNGAQPSIPLAGTTGPTYSGTFTGTAATGSYSVRVEAGCSGRTASTTCSFAITEPPKPELRAVIDPPAATPACGNSTAVAIRCEEKPYGGSWGVNGSMVTGWSLTGFASHDCAAGVSTCTGNVQTEEESPNVTVSATCYVAPGTHRVDSASDTRVISCTGWSCRSRLRIMPRGGITCGQALTSDLACEYWTGGGTWDVMAPASVTAWSLYGFNGSTCAAGMSECTATLNTSAAQLNYYVNATCFTAGPCPNASVGNYLSCSEGAGDKIWVVNASCTPACVQTKMVERRHMYQYLLGRMNCPEMPPNATLDCRISVLNENPTAVNAMLNLSLPSDYETQSVTLPASAVSSFDFSVQGPPELGRVFEGRVQLRKQGRLEDAHVVPILGSVSNVTITRVQQFAMPEYGGWFLPAALLIIMLPMLLLRERRRKGRFA